MLTQFDIIVCVITLLYVTWGFFKGAIKSILGLGKWYGAGVLTLILYPKIKTLLAAQLPDGMVLNAVAMIATYVAVLVLLSIIVSILVSALGGTVGGPSDRILGAAVGLTIGIIIASTAHYFIRSFKGGKDPDWLQKGETYQITSQGADKLQGYFKNVVQNMGVDLGFVKNLDPTGSLASQIQGLQANGSVIDMDKLKDAVRMMKDEGMSPNQIKDMINVQDYMTAGSAQQVITNTTKQLQNAMPKGQ